MNISPKLKGYLWAFVATIALANVYIFSKAAMRELVFAQFAFYWFAMAIIWNLSYIFIRKKQSIFLSINRKMHFIIAVIGVFEVLGTITFFNAIKIVENPANVSFLANFVPIFVTIIGVTFLRERYNFIEIIGIILALFGTFLISYKGNGSPGELFMKGSGIIVLASFCYGMAHVISKKYIHQIDPLLLTLNRVIYLFVLSVVLIIIAKHSLRIPNYALVNIAVGSFLGPFLTAVAAYSSLLYIEVSRSAIVQSTKGLFVVIGAILYLGVVPYMNEIIGGIISIAGVILISIGKPAKAYIIRRRNI